MVKHATAKTLSLSLRTDETIELIVADDGAGFEWSWRNFFLGLLNVIFGIIVMGNPVFTVAVFVRIFAVIAILGGLALLYAAWRIRSLAS